MVLGQGLVLMQGHPRAVCGGGLPAGLAVLAQCLEGVTWGFNVYLYMINRFFWGDFRRMVFAGKPWEANPRILPVEKVHRISVYSTGF